MNLAMLIVLGVGVLAILRVEPVSPIADNRQGGVAVMTRGNPVPLHRQEAVTGLRFLTHRMFNYDARGPAEEREAGIERWRVWWERREGR